MVSSGRPNEGGHTEQTQVGEHHVYTGSEREGRENLVHKFGG